MIPNISITTRKVLNGREAEEPGTCGVGAGLGRSVTARSSGGADQPAAGPAPESPQVSGDHATGADHRALTDAYPGADQDPGAEPNVLAQLDRLARLPALAAQAGLERVAGGEQLDARGELTIGADHDRRRVQHHRVEVDEGPGPEADPVTVVAVKRRPDSSPVADLGEQLAEQSIALGPLGVRCRVVALE
jgi:hypothetical protein